LVSCFGFEKERWSLYTRTGWEKTPCNLRSSHYDTGVVMSHHPLNLVLRFLLELYALVAIGAWGWSQTDGLLRLVWAIGIPLVAAFLWGAFRVEGDGGKPLARVPGWARLSLEIIFFGFAVWAQGQVSQMVGLAFGVFVLGHYLISYDRIPWLLKR